MSLNYNQLYSTSFKLEIPGDETLTYFAQSVVLPGITMNEIRVDYKNYMTNMTGNEVIYTPFSCNLLVDEELRNYQFIKAWIESFKDDGPWNELAKDVKLHVLTSNKTPMSIFTFISAFPTGLTDLEFSNQTDQPTVLSVNVTFAYQFYTIQNV